MYYILSTSVKRVLGADPMRRVLFRLPFVFRLACMDQSTTKTHVSDTGILNLPAELRRMVGFAHGGTAMVRVLDGEIRMRSARDVVAELQAETWLVFAGSGESVEVFHRERRTECVQE